MKTQLKQNVLNRYQEGMEPSEIVQEFFSEVSQATIYRWLNEYDEENENLNGIDEEELEYEEEETDHVEQFKGIETVNNQPEKRNKPLQTSVNGFPDTDLTGLLKRKRTVVKEFRKAFNEILVHSSGHEWNQKQLKRVYSRLDAIQDDIEDIFKYDSDEYGNNAFWVVLEQHMDRFQTYASAGGSVELYFDEEAIDEINAILKIEDFDQEFEWETDFKNRYNRFHALLVDYDGEKLNVEAVQDLRMKADELTEILSNYDLEDELPEVKSSLRDIIRDLKQLEKKASESFWGTAVLELDEDVFTFDK